MHSYDSRFLFAIWCVPTACYRLSNPHAQIRAYVFDVIRSTVPRMLLDEAFESKEEISNEVID